MIKSLRDARQQYYGIINHNYALLLIYSMALKCEYFSYKTPRKSVVDERSEIHLGLFHLISYMAVGLQRKN